MNTPGWWLSAKNGKLIKVDEHGSYVLGHPGVFGITQEELDKVLGDNVYNAYDTGKGSIRGKLIVLAARKGWVRVRTNSIQWSLQLYGTAKSGTQMFVKKLGDWPGPNSPFQISDFATGLQDTFPYSKVPTALKDGTLVDAGSSKQAVGRDAAAETGEKEDKKRADGIPANLSDEMKRRVMRGRIGQKAGIPMPDVEESQKSQAKPVVETLWDKMRRQITSLSA